MKDVENNVNTIETPTPEVDYEKLYKQASANLAELTAERDSLKTENTELRAARDQAIADEKKTKELNYTLSRQLNVAQETKKSPEDILASMFLTKGE